MKKIRCLLLAVGLVILPRASSAQIHFAGDEFVAGLGGNLLLRGPWIAPPWRAPLPRALLFTGVSVGYELFMDPSRWRPDHHSGVDLGERALAYGVTELVAYLVGGKQRRREE